MKSFLPHKILSVLSVLAFVLLTGNVVQAQENTTPPAATEQPAVPSAADAPANPEAPPPAVIDETQPPVDPAAADAAKAKDPKDINPNEIPSLLFSYWEHKTIVDAKRSRGLVRPPTDEELQEDLRSQGEEKIKPSAEERDLKLGGIVYKSNSDWTIWLNGKRVTPKAVPKEVMDLKVYNEYIEMKWFDDYTNQIFPIRLRTHQRFNMDTRIFLPG